MLEYYIFTCPECGSQELCRIELNWAYRKEVDIVKRGDDYLPGGTELIDLEYRGIVGFQCAHCHYPDKRHGRFKWKSWKDLEQSGCLTRNPYYGKERVECTICALDGGIIRTHVLLDSNEELTAELRNQMLHRYMPGKQGVVICGRDTVEDMPDITELMY